MSAPQHHPPDESAVPDLPAGEAQSQCTSRLVTLESGRQVRIISDPNRPSVRIGESPPWVEGSHQNWKPDEQK